MNSRRETGDGRREFDGAGDLQRRAWGSRLEPPRDLTEGPHRDTDEAKGPPLGRPFVVGDVAALARDLVTTTCAPGAVGIESRPWGKKEPPGSTGGRVPSRRSRVGSSRRKKHQRYFRKYDAS